jgi:hypothetical protein
MKFYISKNIIIQKHIVNENLSTKLVVLIINGRTTGLLIYHLNIILFQAFSRTLEQLVFSPSLSHHTPMAINRNLTSRINHYLLKLNGTLNQIPDIIDISCLRAKSN